VSVLSGEYKSFFGLDSASTAVSTVLVEVEHACALVNNSALCHYVFPWWNRAGKQPSEDTALG